MPSCGLIYLHTLTFYYCSIYSRRRLCAKWSFVRLGDDYIDIEKAATDFSFHYEKLNSTRFKINIGVDQIDHESARSRILCDPFTGSRIQYNMPRKTTFGQASA